MMTPDTCHAGVTDPGKKSGGRHGMIFGHVQPLLQLAPPAIVHTGHAPLLGPGNGAVRSGTPIRLRVITRVRFSVELASSSL